MDAEVTRQNSPQKPLTKTVLLEIPVGQIMPDPNQPRQYFDEDALAELATSINALGLQQSPVVNFAYIENGRPFYYIKDGERRWTVHKRLGIPKILCVVEPQPYDGLYSLDRKLAQAAANSSREFLTHSEKINLTEEVVNDEMERRKDNPAGAVHAALKRVAETFGTSIAWAANYRALTGLLPEFRLMLDLKDDEERLNFNVGCSLARAPKDVQVDVYKRALKLLKSGGHAAVQRFIVLEVRNIREGRGEKIRGKRPSEDCDNLNRLVASLNRLGNKFVAGRRSRAHWTFVDEVLSRMSTIEIDVLLSEFSGTVETFLELRRALERRRKVNYEKL